MFVALARCNVSLHRVDNRDKMRKNQWIIMGRRDFVFWVLIVIEDPKLGLWKDPNSVHKITVTLTATRNEWNLQRVHVLKLYLAGAEIS